MKGAVWEFWILGTVAVFIAILIFYTFTPMLNMLTDTATTHTFTTPAVNTSFHNMLDYNMNLWNLWPIAVGVVVFLIIFAVSGDEEEFKRFGGI